jgi:hypothetical protein
LAELMLLLLVVVIARMLQQNEFVAVSKTVL